MNLPQQNFRAARKLRNMELGKGRKIIGGKQLEMRSNERLARRIKNEECEGNVD